MAICGYFPVGRVTEAVAHGKVCALPPAKQELGELGVPASPPGMNRFTIKPTFVEEKATSARFVSGSTPTEKGDGAGLEELVGAVAGIRPLRLIVASVVPDGICRTERLLLPKFTTMARWRTSSIAIPVGRVPTAMAPPAGVNELRLILKNCTAFDLASATAATLRTLSMPIALGTVPAGMESGGEPPTKVGGSAPA